jgi:ankyrin repeat protein
MKDPKSEALCKAAARGYADRIRELLVDGAAVDGKDMLGLSPLMYAAEKGHVEAVRALLAAGADSSAKLFGSSVLRILKDKIEVAGMDNDLAKLLPRLKEVASVLNALADARAQAETFEKLLSAR